MAQPTIISTGIPYCLPTQAIEFVNWFLWAQALTDNDVPLANSDAVIASPRLYTWLLQASGIIEMATLKGGRYLDTDLAGIAAATGTATQNQLACMTAQLAYLTGYTFKFPEADSAKITMVQPALSLLDELSTGSRIFSIQEQVDAYQEEAIPAWPLPGPPYKVSREAIRYFGYRSGYGGGAGE